MRREQARRGRERVTHARKKTVAGSWLPPLVVAGCYPAKWATTIRLPLLDTEDQGQFLLDLLTRAGVKLGLAPGSHLCQKERKSWDRFVDTP